ncbi:hypothetical protein IG631_13899 [Alternaria alternata]|nr:hypothetical protein IG631_13899 [Alternaria alternata]
MKGGSGETAGIPGISATSHQPAKWSPSDWISKRSLAERLILTQLPSPESKSQVDMIHRGRQISQNAQSGRRGHHSTVASAGIPSPGVFVEKKRCSGSHCSDA